MARNGLRIGLGCLSIFATLILAGVVYALLSSVLDLSFVFAFSTSYLIAQFIVNNTINYSSNRKGKRSVTKFIVPLSVLAIVFALRSSLLTQTGEKTAVTDEQKITFKDSIIGGKTYKLASNTRTWIDYIGNRYQGELNVTIADYKSSTQFHNSLNINYNSKQFWGELYQKVVAEDEDKLTLIYTELDNLRRKHRLNTRAFAEMIVSCVQDIPYAFVLQEECEAAASYEKSIRDLLSTCPDCCIGNKKYGIQTPVAFIATLKGDCDTRTILIFTILNHFGYDVAILNSTFYKHSILGINLPVKGLFKRHHSKKYYLWETTNKYFKIGQLPNQFSNTNYWHVVLKNK
jgi:hypothetical protein